MTAAYAGASGTTIQRQHRQGIQCMVKGSIPLCGKHEGVLTTVRCLQHISNVELQL